MSAKLSARTDVQPVLSEALLRRFDTPGPRYTSYPTADRFVEAFGPSDVMQALGQRARGAIVGGAGPLSVYVHVPFCESVCYYCACNKVITKHHERAGEYLDALETEIGLVSGVLGARESVSQLHFGGGSPTFLSDPELERLMAALQGAFRISDSAEVSIEVDPRTVSAARLEHLRAIGFNRISFGVQDFDPQVQQAVHRVQPYESVRGLMQSARDLGFQSINADLIYGLPRQTPESFARTVNQIAELRPDRIALYAYAHLPQRFKPQRRIIAEELPTAAQRIEMLGGAIAGFLGRDYTYIGMDHFALADDALAVAKRQGRLHRNFQGYSTQPDCDLVGLGVSAIGRVCASYYQNAKTLPEYYDALRQPHPARGARHRFEPRRPGAPRRHHGDHVPGEARVRIDRAGPPHQHARLFQERARASRADGRSRPGRARAGRRAGHRDRLVRGPCGRDGVRSLSAERPRARALLAHHLMLDAGLVAAGLAMGAAASPHCVTMCGGPCAGLTSGCRSNATGFHLGRTLGYMAGGAVAASSVAALGVWSQAAPVLRPLWMLLHLALLALGMWWLLRGRQPAFMQRDNAVPVRFVGRPKRPLRAALAGLAWVAWPCGALQAALLLSAMASGPVGGALVMGAFALGSMPALAAAPWAWARWQASRAGASASAIDVGALGLRVAGAGLVLSSGWALTHGLWQRVAAWCAT